MIENINLDEARAAIQQADITKTKEISETIGNLLNKEGYRLQVVEIKIDGQFLRYDITPVKKV